VTVEVARGFVGFRREAILFEDGFTRKNWIGGKCAFACGILRARDVCTPGVGISEATGEGDLRR
jgi:hypothetical protein